MLGKIIPLSKITDRRGNLTVAEQLKDVPFEVKRAYWVYDVPGGESRGGHAHKQLYQLIVALSGSFTVNLDDGKERQSYLLNHPWEGLLITPGIWRTLDDFSTGAVCPYPSSEVPALRHLSLVTPQSNRLLSAPSDLGAQHHRS